MGFVVEKLDFVLCEYFEHIEETEWAIRMARAGAHVVGVNCHFDMFVALETVKKMKAGLQSAGLNPYLMMQPIAYLCPDANRQGIIDLPEFPFALEPRVATRWDMHRYAREAWDLGVRYIGGCCGFEAYHIRACCEELVAERGGQLGAGSEKHAQWGGGLKMHTKPWVRARAKKDYWATICPSTGRPFSASHSHS